MNPHETQPDSDPKEIYFDPEGLDSSEQEFSASLEAEHERQEFILDSFPNQPPGNDTSGPTVVSPSAGPETSRGDGGDQFCGGSSHSAQADSDWRDVVSAKVKHYKTLKPRKERYPSLQLRFDSGASWNLDDTPRFPVDHKSTATARAQVSEPLREIGSPIAMEVSTEATARVLEFPRPGMLPFNRDELAEPVVERPRIMEAPELVPPPPALGGILIESERQPEPERQPGLDMPLTTSRLSRRLLAAMADGVLVGAGLGIFGYMFLRFNHSMPPLRTTAEIGTILLLILWFAYQSAFHIFCGTTPGLRAARLRVVKFDGTSLPRSMRRWRVLTSILSWVSLGLGYAWCFFDEDQLSWHDRITKTHLAPK